MVLVGFVLYRFGTYFVSFFGSVCRDLLFLFKGIITSILLSKLFKEFAAYIVHNESIELTRISDHGCGCCLLGSCIPTRFLAVVT